MAASFRPVPDPNGPVSLKDIIPVSNAIMLAIIDEYLHYRTATKPLSISEPIVAVQSMTTSLVSLFKSATGQNRSPDRSLRCSSISEKIKKVYVKDHFIESILEILIVCEREARNMQREAAKNENAWLHSDSSMCAKALHAVRTCLFTGMKSSELKEEFEQAVDTKSTELLTQLKANYTNMLINIDNVDTTNFAIERDNLIGALAALQHLPTINDAFIDGKFDIYKPLKEKTTEQFQTENNIKLHINIPDIFHSAYFFIYYLFNIKHAADRLMKYNNSYQSYLIDVKPVITIESSESSYFARMGTMVVAGSVSVKEEKAVEKEKSEKEEAEKEKAEKDKREKEEAEKERAEKDKREKEGAEKKGVEEKVERKSPQHGKRK